MAKRTNLTKVTKKLANAKMASSKDVRNEVEALQVTSLRMNLEEYNTLIKLVDSKLADTSLHHSEKSKFKTIKDILPSGIDAESGFVETSETTWNVIKNIGKEIGRAADDGFDIGHLHLSSMSTRMEYVRQYYVSKSGHSTNAYQDTLTDHMIALATRIDTLDSNYLAKYRNRTDLNTDDLIAILNTVKADGLSIIESDITATSTFVSNLETNLGAKQIVVFEDSSYNQIRGQLLGKLGTAFSALFIGTPASAQSHDLANILIEADVEWNHMRASPTFNESLADSFDDIFHGKKSKTRRRTSKIRVHRRKRVNNTALSTLRRRIKSRTKVLQTKILAVKNKKKFIIPTVTLKAIINESLANFIQLRMKTSSAKASISYLRYQTGTFSRSARLLTLNRQETGSYFGVYTYQHEPYEVFEQGNKLGSPGRDPRLYIEGAARDIATQVLKKQFKGLALESK